MLYWCLNSLALKVDTFCQAGIHFWLTTMKDIQGYEGLYAITKDGKVWSHPQRRSSKYGKFLSLFIGKKGYHVVGLCRNKKRFKYYVHRLVAQAYIDNPRNFPYINHKNGIKIDNRVENLEWCTHKENIAHAWATGLCEKSRYQKARGAKSGRSKLNNGEVKEMRRLRESGASCIEIGNTFGVHRDTILCIVRRKTWAHI